MRFRRTTALAATAMLVLTVPLAGPAVAHGSVPSGPTAYGYGGAVSTVDPTATAVGIKVLRDGGNAVDAAVAAAATLGVTEPFSAGIGGGGFFVYYDAKHRKVHTIDGRESGPASMTEDWFIDPADDLPYDFPEARVSGLSVGTPGTLATWEAAARKWGTRSLGNLLRPAARVADRGFTVDATFQQQVAANAAVFGQFESTSDIYLPGGAPPAVGSVQRNPDLADTYRLIARRGTDVFYSGRVARDIVRTVQDPPVAEDPIGEWKYPIRGADMRLSDLRNYRLRYPAPTKSDYRGLTVYGMSTPSSGGTAVGEALNILERTDLSEVSMTQALHQYLEASALAFADRNRYVGDDTPAAVLRELLSQGFADERACEITATAAVKPVPPGEPDGTYAPCEAALQAVGGDDEEGLSTTHLTTWDQWGNVVAYTLTIEQTGGSGIVVPDRGFLLNNELTDFNFTPTQGTAPDPNLPAPGKRPRSSMSPTIVLDGGEPVLALGSPGGSMIITTVLQTLLNRLDFGATLPEAVAAPRASQRNTVSVAAEPAFRTAWEAGLSARGHTFTTTAEIGAVTAIELLEDGTLLAAAEPVRRGGGDAGVVGPRR